MPRTRPFPSRAYAEAVICVVEQGHACIEYASRDDLRQIMTLLTVHEHIFDVSVDTVDQIIEITRKEA